MNDREKMYERDRMNANSIFEDRRSGSKKQERRRQGGERREQEGPQSKG